MVFDVYLRDVITGYRDAGRTFLPLLLIHVSLRLAAAAIFAPLAGLLLSAALTTTNQGTLTHLAKAEVGCSSN